MMADKPSSLLYHSSDNDRTKLFDNTSTNSINLNMDTGKTSEDILKQSSNKSFLMNNNDSQLLSNNIIMIPLQDYNEENKEIAAKVKKNKWGLLPIVLISSALIGIGIMIPIGITVSSNQKLSNTISSSARKVLFIIADGIPADVIENATIPNIKKIQQIGKYKRTSTGGDIGTYTETFTISAPGYMNLLTGTWGNKHNVYDNKVQNPNYNYKNIFRLIKEEQSDKKIGIFSTWTDNRIKLMGEGLSKAGNITFDYKFDGYELDLINYPHDPFNQYILHIDQHVTHETAKCIKKNAPDFSWVYLQYTDDVGHSHGDSEQLYEAINYLDQQIGEIYKAIQYRIKYHKENWLIVLTTDHGRDPYTGQHHGNQTERERTTWIVTNNQEMNTYFQEYTPAAVDILPTMARFMNLKIPLGSARELDGVPLTGNISLIKPILNLTGDNLIITWTTLDNTGNVTVWLSTTNLYKVGLIDDYKLIGTVPVQNQIAIFNIKEYSSIFYKIVLQGQYNMVNKWIFRS